MKMISNSSAQAWLAERRIQDGPKRTLSFQGTETVSELLLSPSTTREAIAALGVNLVGILNTGVEWMLWLRDFSIWNDDTDEVGWKIIDTFARAAQQPELNVDSSSMIFDPSEIVSVKACVLIPIVFMWDAYLVNGDGNTFVCIDHDDHSSISTRSAAVAKEIKESQLGSWVLDVK